jgi:hypothetical protein
MVIPYIQKPVGRKTIEQLSAEYQCRLAKYGVTVSLAEVVDAARRHNHPTSLIDEMVARWLEDDRRTGIEIVE